MRWGTAKVPYEHAGERFFLAGEVVRVEGVEEELRGWSLGGRLEPEGAVLATVADSSALEEWRREWSADGRLLSDTSEELLGLRDVGDEKGPALTAAVEAFLALEDGHQAYDLPAWEEGQVSEALGEALGALLGEEVLLVFDPDQELTGSARELWESSKVERSGGIVVGVTASGLPVSMSEEAFEQLLALDPVESAEMTRFLLDMAEQLASEGGADGAP